MTATLRASAAATVEVSTVWLSDPLSIIIVAALKLI